MTRWIFFLHAAFALLLMTRPAEARELSEAEYLASFHAQHPARVILDEPLARARADVRSAGQIENPVGIFEREAPGDIGQNTWSLSWRPPLDGRVSARKAAAEASLEAARGEQTLAGAELRATLREAYARWALAAERRTILGAHTALLRSIVAGATKRAQAGEASVLSARRITFAAVEVDAEAARAGASSAAARAGALGWLGASGDDLDPSLPSLPDEPDAGAESAALRARRLQLDAAQAGERASGRFIEFPALSFGWQTIRGDEAETSGPVMGATWAIPLFDRRQGERDASKASLSAARARLDLESTGAAARLSAAREGYRILREAALATADSLATSDDMLAAAAARYESGESDVTELLETVRGVLSARLAALDLYDAALAAHRELEVLVGRAWDSEEK